MDHECNKDLAINMLINKVDKIDSNVESLLKFKWQIMGGAALFGTILGTSFSLILGSYLKKLLGIV